MTEVKRTIVVETLVEYCASMLAMACVATVASNLVANWYHKKEMNKMKADYEQILDDVDHCIDIETAQHKIKWFKIEHKFCK